MKALFSLSFLLTFGFCHAQNELYFPPTNNDPWETITPAEIGWCEAGLDTLSSFLEERNTKAFIMLYQGKIVVEEYFDEFTADSLWLWNSAGKTVTATVIGIAEQEGLLDLEDPASNYLGEGWTSATPEQEEAITVWNQLTMTTGLNDADVDVYCTAPECLQYLDDAGERWAYHNGPYTLLQDVIAGATGQGMNLYTYLRLLQPTGMGGLFLPIGDNRIFTSKPRDMARFGLLMQNGGVWDETPILTNAAFFEAMVNPTQDLNKSYGYLWWLNGYESYRIPGFQLDIPGPLFPNAPADLYAALGKDSQVIHVVPSEDLVLIRMGLSPDDELISINFNVDLWDVLDFLFCDTPDMVTDIEVAKLHVFPNPATTELNLSDLDPNTRWTIYDLSGRALLTGKGISVDLQQFSAGYYLISVASNGTEMNARFIVE
ncbi:MAG: CubicO group peptidase (beta-lactamase class C family) [Flavobacteriales bacterium]|jgi:CubicO group peptidase (beta-lactamase class C family)